MTSAKTKKSKREPRRGPANAENVTHDDGLDGLVERLLPLVRQIQALQEQARALGVFPNDRELLSCPHCGLAEDVLVGGYLVTCYAPGDPDTGLRFLEPQTDEGPFLCPACGREAQMRE